MIRKADSPGLIVSVCAAGSTAALEMLVQLTGWPLISGATTSLLQCQLVAHLPVLVLFWLDRNQELPATAELLTWLREVHPAVWRAVLAYRLRPSAEPPLRAAGAQLYLPSTGDLRSLVERTLLPLVKDQPDGGSDPSLTSDRQGQRPAVRAAPDRHRHSRHPP